jgi:hypothetical protein
MTNILTHYIKTLNNAQQIDHPQGTCRMKNVVDCYLTYEGMVLLEIHSPVTGLM